MTQVAERDSPLHGVRVLLVEDDEMVRDVIGRLLLEYGAEVTATAGVTEALNAFRREHCDVVLSDIEMPREDGYALIRKLRALPRSQGGDVPAAALTGLSASESRGRVLRAGFDDHLAKPVHARVLVGAVAALAAKGWAARKRPGAASVS